MKNPETGGPAFPTPEQRREIKSFDKEGDSIGSLEIITAEDVHPGMSLRDYFAAKAMQGILANDVCMRQLMAHHPDGNLDRAGLAMIADKSYRYADAMLEARKISVDEPDEGG